MSSNIKIRDNILGNARLSTPQELKNEGLMSGSGGVVFGRINNNLVEKTPAQQGHSLIVGGTGTGKSRGVAIPTLLRWEGSVLAIDIKGELSKTTADYRRKKGKVYVFDPDEGESPYDPLQGCKTPDGALELARTLIKEPSNGDPFWSMSAQGLLAAAALEGALKESKFTDVIERLCTTEAEKLIKELQSSEDKGVRMLSSVGADMTDKTMSGVFSQLKSSLLTIGADPNIEKATFYSSWTPETLEEGASIYLRVSEKMLNQYKALWTIIVSQILRYLSDRSEGANPPILIILDEFARLGKISMILDALATLRSRNVHIALFVQSMAQLDHIYSPAERKVIADNCAYKLVLSATDPETQKYFSDLSGQKTIWVGNQSSGSSYVFLGDRAENKSQGMSQHATPLIRPEEFARLSHPVLFAPNVYPSYVSKAYWDKDQDIAPIVGIKDFEKPVKMDQEKDKPKKKRSTMIIFTLSILISLAIGFMFMSQIFSFMEHSKDVQKHLAKQGNFTAQDLKNLKELNRNKFLLAMTIIANPITLGVYISIVSGIFIPLFGLMLLGRRIFGSIVSS